MYADQEVFVPPTNPEIPVWRYVDLAKLLALLQQSSLWLSRADFLGDPHEGALGRMSASLREQELRNLPWGPDVTHETVERLISDNPRRTRAFTRHTFVNCWHMNETESVAMWQVYAGAGAPVAVRSTYEQLCASLRGEDATYVGLVRYVDPDVDLIPWGNTFAPFMHKRHAFAYERELRVVQARMPVAGNTLDLEAESPAGVAEPVDLATLINEVVVGPNQPAWYRDVVEETVEALAPGIPVAGSSIDTAPVW